MKKTLKLKTQLILGFTIVLLPMIIVTSVVYVDVKRLIESSGWVTHTYEVMAKANAMIGSLVDQETGVRGYLVTGDETYLDPYTSGKTAFRALIDELKRTVSDNPAQVERLNRIDTLTTQLESQFNQPVMALRAEINRGETELREFQEISARTVGKDLFDELRAQIAEVDEAFQQAGNQQGQYLTLQVLMDMVNQETGQRGFLLTGQDVSLEPYTSGIASFRQNTSRLNDFVRDNPRFGITVADINEIVAQASRWRSEAADPEIEARRDMNNITATLADLEAFMAQGIGKQYMDGIREVVDEFTSIEASLLAVRNEEAQDIAQEAILVAVIGALIAILIGVLSSVWVIRSTSLKLGLDPNQLNAMARRQADGYLDQDDQEHRGVAGSMQAVSLKLRDTVSVVQQGTQSVSSISDQLSSAAEQLSTGMATQSERVSMIATASTEMAQTSMDIAKSVNIVQQNSVSALELAEAGGDKVSQSAKSMSQILNDVTVASTQATDLESKANQVQEVVGIISSIAEQTNLLALNAAIEAARAGEAGRGFAVVADEVRSLAERSSKSTQEINAIIGSMQQGVGQVVGTMAQVTDKAEEGNQVAQESAKSFTQIVVAMQSLQEHVTQNAASIDEMSSTAEQITTDIQAISEIADESHASAEHIAQASGELVENMHTLTTSVSYFKLS
ncbi:MAG: CHASE3 domain-containing protein [Saccharospirillum sp.]